MKNLDLIAFDVSCIGFNAEVFEQTYSQYILLRNDAEYDYVTYALKAPKQIYDEIDDLKEELIEIIK